MLDYFNVLRAVQPAGPGGSRLAHVDRGAVMDFPLIYWLLPPFLFSDEARMWIRDNTPCWLGGYCP
ncbi:hypothetical protein DEU38_13912 [Rhodococcus sp. AG1013]|uniref:hypothetical protein n=1 Tax=Rhodococcus sp. AG1013 TaxID=2183996 RepID=UPI000E2D61AC|nr:hypothetical protein [Rhodococcus sp. AG1013]RDI12043.1 hypothetical protein DEU38_13912 [Rhodococcus sp. AG1013]